MKNKYLVGQATLEDARRKTHGLEDCDYDCMLNPKQPRFMQLPSQQALHPRLKKFYDKYGMDWKGYASSLGGNERRSEDR